MGRFPVQRLFACALLLPLAMPAYLIAYVYTDLLDFAGPVQNLLRDTFGWTSRRDYWFPEIRSLGGATAMLTLVLYPYVYALARASFLEKSVFVRDASSTPGHDHWRSLPDAALPRAPPAIPVGMTLALIEC